jgi:enoyl-CoA hydratase
MTVADFEQVRYDKPAAGVARITMARAKVRNAQGLRMTYEINRAFDLAVDDTEVRAIILAGDDPHFSAGHDLSDPGTEEFPRVGTWGGYWSGGAAGRFAHEMEIFLEMCERWRNLSKPTIALIQGKCIAGGLMLAWVCDLIVASDDASFRDPTIDMGVMGAEFFMHPWELGVRQAKEFLFTTDWLSAEQARQFGMVNRVVAREKLASTGIELASTIARKPEFAVRAAKLAVNHAQDLMGRSHALRHSFALHHLTHAHNELVCGVPTDPSGTSSNVREKMLEANQAHPQRKA